MDSETHLPKCEKPKFVLSLFKTSFIALVWPAAHNLVKAFNSFLFTPIFAATTQVQTTDMTKWSSEGLPVWPSYCRCGQSPGQTPSPAETLKNTQCGLSFACSPWQLPATLRDNFKVLPHQALLILLPGFLSVLIRMFLLFSRLSPVLWSLRYSLNTSSKLSSNVLWHLFCFLLRTTTLRQHIHSTNCHHTSSICPGLSSFQHLVCELYHKFIFYFAFS